MNDQDLRDCFAMFTLCGIVMRGIGEDVVDEVAINAYKMADAMLKARKKKYWVEEEETAGLPAIKRKARKS